MNCLKRISIITGNLGSGKTEVAINLAIMLKKLGRPTALVDLDIINPYFRTRLVMNKITDMGVKVVAPAGHLVMSDIPALSPEIKGVIENRTIYGVFDVGGDDVGATALGRYREQLLAEEFKVIFVVNANRPFTRDSEGIIKYIDSIEKASGLKVKGLVNNSNLGTETSLNTVIEGFDKVQAVSEILKIPILFTAVDKSLESQARIRLKGRSEVFPIRPFMEPPWKEEAF
ncbi:MAG: hypothetical protein ACOY46_10875 [Bacillota bacterium]